MGRSNYGDFDQTPSDILIMTFDLRPFLKKLAVFFGAGYSPKAPGTVGTLATIPLYWLLMQPGPLFYMSFVVFLLPLAILAAEVYEQEMQRHDSSEIVIDEVLGFLITMTWLPLTWQAVTLGFFIFRFLDILKPFPIGYLDKKVQGGLGVIVDDVAAGIIANILLQILYTKTALLGAQVL